MISSLHVYCLCFRCDRDVTRARTERQMARVGGVLLLWGFPIFDNDLLNSFDSHKSSAVKGKIQKFRDNKSETKSFVGDSDHHDQEHII